MAIQKTYMHVQVKMGAAYLSSMVYGVFVFLRTLKNVFKMMGKQEVVSDVEIWTVYLSLVSAAMMLSCVTRVIETSLLKINADGTAEVQVDEETKVCCCLVSGSTYRQTFINNMQDMVSLRAGTTTPALEKSSLMAAPIAFLWDAVVKLGFAKFLRDGDTASMVIEVVFVALFNASWALLMSQRNKVHYVSFATSSNPKGINVHLRSPAEAQRAMKDLCVVKCGTYEDETTEVVQVDGKSDACCESKAFVMTDKFVGQAFAARVWWFPCLFWARGRHVVFLKDIKMMVMSHPAGRRGSLTVFPGQGHAPVSFGLPLKTGWGLPYDHEIENLESTLATNIAAAQGGEADDDAIEEWQSAHCFCGPYLTVTKARLIVDTHPCIGVRAQVSTFWDTVGSAAFRGTLGADRKTKKGTLQFLSKDRFLIDTNFFTTEDVYTEIMATIAENIPAKLLVSEDLLSEEIVEAETFCETLAYNLSCCCWNKLMVEDTFESVEDGDVEALMADAQKIIEESPLKR